MQRTDFADLWETSQGARTMGPLRTNGSGYTPNLSAFTSLLFSAELQAEELGFTNVMLIHDQQSQFNAPFTYWFDTFRRSQPVDETLPNGNRLRLPLRQLTSIVFADSETEVGIRISDVVASALRVLLQETMANQIERSTDFADALKTLCRARDRMGDFPAIIGPESWQFSTWDLLVGTARTS
jgi:hypothetical protein